MHAQEEKDSTRATVDEDRKHAIEAAIVRIMKTRKTLDHQKLVRAPPAMATRDLPSGGRRDRGAATARARPPSRRRVAPLHLRAQVLEASTQLMRHFKPDPKQIKKRIEDLIAREYLERDENNPQVYKYLA